MKRPAYQAPDAAHTEDVRLGIDDQRSDMPDTYSHCTARRGRPAFCSNVLANAMEVPLALERETPHFPTLPTAHILQKGEAPLQARIFPLAGDDALPAVLPCASGHRITAWCLVHASPSTRKERLKQSASRSGTVYGVYSL